MNRTPHLAALVCLACLFVASDMRADDWPQWRGPQRDGVWRETGLLEKFPAEQLPSKWRAKISSGYSGPTVAAGRVYLTDRVVEPEQIEQVHCFDEATGKSLWTHRYNCVYKQVGYQAGPRASVSIDGDRAYALGTMGNLFCLDAASGKVRWEKDLSAEYEIEMPIWGISAAPLVEGELLILHVGGANGASVVALDKSSGSERWRALADRAQYAAPVIVEQAGKRVVVSWTGDAVVGLDPLTGKVYWRHEMKPTRMPIGIATPIVDRGRLFVSSFYDGSLMLRLKEDAPAVEEMWRRLGPDEQHTESIHCMIGTPVFDGDQLYGVDSYGELRCLDPATGDRVWEDLSATPKARWSTIHMVKNGDNYWMFNERGELLIGRLSPQGFKELSRTKLIEPTLAQLAQRHGVCWSHPAFANRCVFVRNDEELVAFDVAAR